MYSQELLSNPPAGALRVKSIAGNSGGALLGFFVAGLEAKDSRSLSTNLWMPGGRLLTDRAIFGFMVEGLFYFLCQCLMLFIDNCVVPRTGVAKAGAGPRATLEVSGAALLLIGCGTAFGPAWCSWQDWQRWLKNDLGGEMTIGGAIFCAGVVLWWVGLILWLAGRGRYRLEKPWVFVRMVAMTIGIILLTCLTMWLCVAVGAITFLELTPGFWVALVALTAIWAMIYSWLFNSENFANPLRGWPREAFEYQRSRHPSGLFSLTRLVRIHIIFTFEFCVWNATVAPAIYGNKNAHEYLVQAVKRFVAGRSQAPKTYELQTLYAAPANDLAAKRERYFLFYPPRDDLSNTVALLREKLNDDARKRWTVLPFSDPEAMQKVVFASGSPFPIFPPHAVTNVVKERLVDGGFAHNVPVEAARQLGARQVIVLDSSPASESQPSAHSSTNGPVFGQLSLNIPRLLPFLFESSQAADLLSREEMFIVTLAPRAEEKKWPWLADFSQKTVRRLLETAKRDTTNRIGRIEACGTPAFLVFISN
jgi:hypothetical protein